MTSEVLVKGISGKWEDKIAHPTWSGLILLPVQFLHFFALVYHKKIQTNAHKFEVLLQLTMEKIQGGLILQLFLKKEVKL